MYKKTQHFRRNPSLGASFLLLGLCLVAACEGEGVEGEIVSTRKIVNGAPTKWESWTGVVGVIPLFGNPPFPIMMCTGTLIQPDVVLTAGHCVFNRGASALDSFDLRDKPRRIAVKGGANLGMGMGGFTVGKPVEVSAHPSWVGKVEVGSIDLALIKLEEPVTNLPWYCLRRDSMVQVGEPGVVVGYGVTSVAAQMTGGVHRSGETTVQSVLDRLIEVGDPSSTCQGDSGGPFFTIERDRHSLTGVTSFGTKAQCSAVDDSWEVNLLTYLDWIDEEVERLTGAPMSEECTGTGPNADLDPPSLDSDSAATDTDTASEIDAPSDSGLESDTTAESDGEDAPITGEEKALDDPASSGGGGCSITPTVKSGRWLRLFALLD